MADDKEYKLGILGEIIDGIVTDIKDIINPPKSLGDLVERGNGFPDPSDPGQTEKSIIERDEEREKAKNGSDDIPILSQD